MDEFVGNNRFRFVLQSRGIFHPKVYFFESTDGSWDLLIGSANLTHNALTRNTELLLHVSDKDVCKTMDNELCIQVKTIINEYYEKGEKITKKKATSYRNMWESKMRTTPHESEEHKSEGRVPVDTKIMPMSWGDFYKRVKRVKKGNFFEERLDLLDMARKEFSEVESFSKIDCEKRRIIAGIVEKGALFGVTSGALSYTAAIKNNNKHVSDALDYIPQEGVVTRDNYFSYLEVIEKIFQKEGDNLGMLTATRLLALKRPDQFVCINAANNSKLCEDFGIEKLAKNGRHRYWDEIISRIMDSAWWNSPMPLDKEQKRVWRGRAAMLDAIFYDPKKK